MLVVTDLIHAGVEPVNPDAETRRVPRPTPNSDGSNPLPGAVVQFLTDHITSMCRVILAADHATQRQA